MRIMLATRVFFKALFDGAAAAAFEAVLRGETPRLTGAADATTGTAAEEKKVVKEPSKKTAVRSEAVTLLASLQREARLVDLVKEDLAQYSDAQVGAAARDVLRDCGRVLDRMFDLNPLLEKSEGEDVELPEGFDPGCYRLTGNVTDRPPYRGTLAHHGWRVGRCDLPSWSGSDESARVVAPAELEVK